MTKTKFLIVLLIPNKKINSITYIRVTSEIITISIPETKSRIKTHLYTGYDIIISIINPNTSDRWALKYEDIKIKDYVSLPQLRFGVQHDVNFYNTQRIHSALQYKTPYEVYFGSCNSATTGYISSRPFTPIF